jgi:hypothetical protein
MLLGSKSSKVASHAESASTLVQEEKFGKDNASGKAFSFRIFKGPQSGRVIKRIDILREGWTNRVFKDLNSNVSTLPLLPQSLSFPPT